MKIGIVCPYSFDAHGGVQQHIIDLRAKLEERGHQALVLAPAQETSYPWLSGVGGAIPITYNGSVARLTFGPKAARATKNWLETNNFDIVHIHEPASPSVSMIALAQVKGPVVATFHTAMENSAALSLAAPILAPLLEKLGGRIAVSAEARRTLIQHQGGDAVIIPNGVDTAFFHPGQGHDKSETPKVLSFLGRLDEERKGLKIFAEALAKLLAKRTDIQVRIAGRGEAPTIREQLAQFGERVVFLGGISDTEKAQLFQDSTIYVAPQTGGESFGIVLVEAMAAGACVVASNIPAFAAVLDNANAGALFANGDPADLARVIDELLDQPMRLKQLAQRGSDRSRIYDWETVTDQIELVYQAVCK